MGLAIPDPHRQRGRLGQEGTDLVKKAAGTRSFFGNVRKKIEIIFLDGQTRNFSILDTRHINLHTLHKHTGGYAQ